MALKKVVGVIVPEIFDGWMVLHWNGKAWKAYRFLTRFVICNEPQLLSAGTMVEAELKNGRTSRSPKNVHSIKVLKSDSVPKQYKAIVEKIRKVKN